MVWINGPTSMVRFEKTYQFTNSLGPSPSVNQVCTKNDHAPKSERDDISYIYVHQKGSVE